MNSAPRMALFGTSADPPHKGHYGVLTTLGHQFDYVAVWASDNPWKQKQSPIEARMAMLGLVVAEIDAPHPVRVHPELSHPYTAVTLERARRIWPQADFTFVIGADLIKQLPSWHRATDVIRWAKLLVFHRPGYNLQEQDLSELRQLGARVAIATPAEQHDISSSRLRQDCGRQQKMRYGIPAVVQAYIHQHDLYPCPENKTTPTR